MEMQRVVKGYPSPVYFELTNADEALTNADGSVTYTSVRANGAAGPSGTATNISTGVYRALVTHSTIDRLTFTVTATVAGSPATLTVVVECVGRRLFTLAELKSFDSSVINANTLRLSRARDMTEREFERETGRAFTPVYERELLGGDGTYDLWLKWADLLEVTALTVDGTDVLADVTLGHLNESPNVLTSDRRWQGTVDIVYIRGMETPPIDVKEAAMLRTVRRVLGRDSRIDDRATLMSIPDFGTFQLATPGQRGSRTGIPSVDVVLDDYDIRPEGFA